MYTHTYTHDGVTRPMGYKPSIGKEKFIVFTFSMNVYRSTVKSDQIQSDL